MSVITGIGEVRREAVRDTNRSKGATDFDASLAALANDAAQNVNNSRTMDDANGTQEKINTLSGKVGNRMGAIMQNLGATNMDIEFSRHDGKFSVKGEGEIYRKIESAFNDDEELVQNYNELEKLQLAQNNDPQKRALEESGRRVGNILLSPPTVAFFVNQQQDPGFAHISDQDRAEAGKW